MLAKDFLKEHGDRFYEADLEVIKESRYEDGKIIPVHSEFKIWRSGGIMDGDEIYSVIYLHFSNANKETISVSYAIPPINWFVLREDMLIIEDFLGCRGYTILDA